MLITISQSPSDVFSLRNILEIFEKKMYDSCQSNLIIP